MKNVFLFRHSYYNEYGEITPAGVNKIEVLVKNILSLGLDLGRAKIWTSTVIYAIKSAEVLKSQLNLTCGIEIFPELGEMDNPEKYYDWVKNKIETSKDEIIIVVTHSDYVGNVLVKLLENYPTYENLSEEKGEGTYIKIDDTKKNDRN